MKLKFGLIGLGNQAQENLIPALREVSGIEIYAISSRDNERAKKIADRYDISRVIKPIEIFDLCDAIVIGATPEVHFQYIRDFIRFGKAIFVEKPPVESLEQYYEMRKIIKENNLIVGFGFNFRHADFYGYLTKQTNDFKNVKFMKIKSYAAKPDTKMWNCVNVLDSSLLAIHIHAIEMLCYSLNSKPVAIQKEIVWLDKNKFIANIAIKFENDKLGVLELSNVSNRFEYAVECANDKEVWRCDDFNKIEHFRNDISDDKISQKSRTIYETPFLRGGFSRTGYQTEFEQFAKRVGLRENNWREIDILENVYQIITEIVDE